MAAGAGCIAKPSSRPELVMFVSSALVVILKTSEDFGLKGVYFFADSWYCHIVKGAKVALFFKNINLSLSGQNK